MHMTWWKPHKVIYYLQLYPINSSLRPFSCTPESVVSLPWKGKRKKWPTSTIYIFMIIYKTCVPHMDIYFPSFGEIWITVYQHIQLKRNSIDKRIGYHNCWTLLRGNVFINTQLDTKTCAQTGYQLIHMHTCMPGSPGYTTANGIKPLQCPS